MSPHEILVHRASMRQHWFHSFEVLPGIWTNGAKPKEHMELEANAWGLPQDLSGMTVLDIGCADGGFSAAALKRGAASVLGMDDQMTTGMRLIVEAGALPRFEFRKIDLFSQEFMDLPQFDFIIFAGVLYHVHDMLEALKRVRSKTRGQAVLETIFNQTAGSEPPLALFWEGTQANDDATNWWGPNFACLEGMLRVAGFRFERTFTFTAPGHEDVEGRVAYLLRLDASSAFARVTEGATGTHGPLEEALQRARELEAEVKDLRGRLNLYTS